MSLVERDTCLRCNVLLKEVEIQRTIASRLTEELQIRENIIDELVKRAKGG